MVYPSSNAPVEETLNTTVLEYASHKNGKATYQTQKNSSKYKKEPTTGGGTGTITVFY